MKLVIHIGVHKTGTSALQGLLHTNRERLRSQGVWYDPPEGEKNHSSRVFHFRPGETYSPEIFRDRLKAISDQGCPLYLMSSEMFVEAPFDMEAFARSIRGFKTEVIAYLCASDDLLVSAYNQVVRAGTRLEPLQDKRPYDPTYRASLTQWISDQWKLTLAPYDPKQWPGQNIFLDLLSMLGVSADGMDTEGRQEDANRSLPAPLIEAVRVANMVGIKGELRDALMKGFLDLSRKRPDLFEHGNLASDDERRNYRGIFAQHADLYRPFYRYGFDEAFLLP
ncbi:hypothetical protein [Mangrovicella endophytica]|uniref:hypothetical protein n=1 Tax=Mangrovicella endophytica TaxID=2066697 RepID=UPI0012FFFB62|nr:hypothetical protein [Mangrovicella endophytica]